MAINNSFPYASLSFRVWAWDLSVSSPFIILSLADFGSQSTLCSLQRNSSSLVLRSLPLSLVQLSSESFHLGFPLSLFFFGPRNLRDLTHFLQLHYEPAIISSLFSSWEFNSASFALRIYSEHFSFVLSFVTESGNAEEVLWIWLYWNSFVETRSTSFSSCSSMSPLVQNISSGATFFAPENGRVAPDDTFRCDCRCDKVASESPHLMILGATF